MDDAAALLEPLIPALRRYAYALTRESDAADDLVQDTLERALDRWWLRRRGDDLRPWLFAILRNLHIDDLRRRRRRGVAGGLEEAADIGTRPTQEAALESRDLMSALAGLSEDHRSILLLVGVEDLSYVEVARVLDVPVGTVMSRLARARARLRAVLDQGSAALLRRVK